MSNKERNVDIFLIVVAKLWELYKNSAITSVKKQNKKNPVMPADRFPVGLSGGLETYHRLTGPLRMLD